MTARADKSESFLAGVIEGFYGPPWSAAERATLFEWMSNWGLNTYLYAPKDDLKHRALWREPYLDNEVADLRLTLHACNQRNIRFIYGLSPGLDIGYSEPTDLAALEQRFGQLIQLGCPNFALLFDDIPDQIRSRDQQRYGSFAAAQCAVANEMFRWTRDRIPNARFLFCPTPYCGRMADRQLGGTGYLETVGRDLLPEIEVFWTGPEIISPEISLEQAQAMAGILRRKPILWDNLYANDYDGRRFYCGPYAGRPPELRQAVNGLLCNPNTEFPLNFVPLQTFAAFLRNATEHWDSREAYVAAMREWLPAFAIPGAGPWQGFSVDDLILLGDCFYLPSQNGPEAETLLTIARQLATGQPATWGDEAGALRRRVSRLREICGRLAGLRDRPLFHALSRRAWELREEMDLWDRYLAFRAENPESTEPFRSDSHLPQIYRGGFVAQIQNLLLQQPDGTFLPNPGKTTEGPLEPDILPRS